MLLDKLNVAPVMLLAGALLVSGPSAVVTGPLPEQPAVPVRGDQKREVKVKWEYKALTAPNVEKLAPKGSGDRLTDGLNQLGEQGWELVAVVPPQLPGLGGMKMGGGGPGMPPGPPGGGFLIPPAPSTYVFKRPK
jgi:hypothetical protein